MKYSRKGRGGKSSLTSKVKKEGGEDKRKRSPKKRNTARKITGGNYARYCKKTMWEKKN